MEDFRKQPAWVKVVILLGSAVLIAILVSILGLLNPGKEPLDECTFPVRINCFSYDVSLGGIELELQNGLGRDVIVKEITTLSYAVEGGECTTGEINRLFPNGKLDTFSLKGMDGGGCIYRETGRKKNRYEIEIVYGVKGTENERIPRIAIGDLLTRPPIS